jgi:hypothetical protein
MKCDVDNDSDQQRSEGDPGIILKIKNAQKEV